MLRGVLAGLLAIGAHAAPMCAGLTPAFLKTHEIEPSDREDAKLRILYLDWGSQQLVSEMFKILTVDALGYKETDVTFVEDSGSISWLKNFVEEDAVDFALELWMYSKPDYMKHRLETKKVIALGNVGYYGQSGYYFPTYMTTTTWKTAQSITGAFFPHYWETLTDVPSVEKMYKNFSQVMVDNWATNFGNASSRHSADPGHTTMPLNTFTPPWCDASTPEKCVNIVMVKDTWDTGTVQAQIMNLGLNATAEFWGGSAHADLADYMITTNQPIYFYYYEPSSLLAQYLTTNQLQRVTFPTPNGICWSGANAALTGIGSTVDCDYQKTELVNMGNAATLELPVHEDARVLLEKFEIADYQINPLLMSLLDEPHASAANTHESAACAWLVANPSVWTPWVTNSYKTTQIHVSSGVSDMFWAFIVVYISVACTLLGLFLHARKKPQIRVVSVPFMSLAWTGCVVVAIAAIFHLNSPTTMTECHCRWWLGITGGCLIMGPLLAKSYRTYRIFEVESKSISNRKVGNWDVLGWVAGLYLPMMALLIANSVVNEAIGLVRTDNLTTLEYEIECPVDPTTSTLLLIGITCYILALAYVAFISRNLPDDFNEIIHMMYLSLLLLLTGGFAAAMWSFANTSPTPRAAIGAGANLIMSFAVIITLFGPKVYLVVTGQASRNVETTGSVVSRGAASVIPDGSMVHG